MAKVRMKGFTMDFMEPKRDEEGEIMRDKNGNIIKVRVTRVVRHNAAYFPFASCK